MLLTLLSLMEQIASNVRTIKLFLIFRLLNAKNAPMIQSLTLRNILVNKSYITLTIKMLKTICLMELPYQLLPMVTLLALHPDLFLMVHVSNVLFQAIGTLKKINAKIVHQVKYSTSTQNYVQFLYLILWPICKEIHVG